MFSNFNDVFTMVEEYGTRRLSEQYGDTWKEEYLIGKGHGPFFFPPDRKYWNDPTAFHKPLISPQSRPTFGQECERPQRSLHPMILEHLWKREV